MAVDETPPLQLIVVEGGGYCDPETGICSPVPTEVTEADPPLDADEEA